MNEKSAWDDFEKTGSIEAYIRYVQLKEGWIPEDEDAIPDRRFDNKGEHSR